MLTYLSIQIFTLQLTLNPTLTQNLKKTTAKQLQKIDKFLRLYTVSNHHYRKKVRNDATINHSKAN